MKQIGDPTSTTPDGARLELRFENEQGTFLTVHTDCIVDYSLAKISGAVDLLQLTLKAPRGAGLGLLRDEAIVEMWHHSGHSSNCIGVIRSEHVEGGSDESGEYIHIQGRSPCGYLIDTPLSLEHAGSLRDLIHAIAPGDIDLSPGVPDVGVHSYISSPSVFGALRLVATSMGLVVRDAGRRAAVATREEVAEQIRRRPVARITDENAQRVRFTRGVPIRPRE